MKQSVEVMGAHSPPHGGLTERVEFFRLDGGRRLDQSKRGELGQFMTPVGVARFMASLLDARGPVRLLDAGAGVGSLSAAAVETLCARKKPPPSIDVTAFEIDPTLADYLRETFKLCRSESSRSDVKFSSKVVTEDFIQVGTAMMRKDLFAKSAQPFNAAILNPPYKKIRTDSEARRLLQSVGIETSNLYTAFLSIAVELLEPGGELVAITPRSFCNGPYFKPFRERFLAAMSLRRIHVFESRDEAFSDDEVLQETVIFHAVKSPDRRGSVVISSSASPDSDDMTVREVPYGRVVEPADKDFFIRIVTDDIQNQVAQRMAGLPCDLRALGLTVSTGRVVDFRAKDALRADPEPKTVPLVYPTHFEAGFVKWPKLGHKKPNALMLAGSDALLVPTGWYALVKRFSAKEEPRRVVAAVYDPGRVPGAQVGFENHLNYFHQDGKPLTKTLSKGLAVFLNSTLVDEFFRQFNGHTQVNATDLRSLRYPDRAQLDALGSRIGDTFPDQDEIDQIIEEELFHMAAKEAEANPLKGMKRINEALAILKTLNMPREQQNERSALTLLALLDLKPSAAWKTATNPLRGITPLMDFIKDEYGKEYAPNTRETIRRQTVHQFMQAGLIVLNPDKPSRAVNSPHNVYQVTPLALDLLRSFGSDKWIEKLEAYRKQVQGLVEKYAQDREMQRIPVLMKDENKQVFLTPGGQNDLIKLVVEEFCSRYTPGGKVLYIGDAGDKWAFFDREVLASLGVSVDEHGKMPDVVVHYAEKNWLVLIEAVTSHGPVNPKRREELQVLFKGSKAGLVYVTAFLSRSAMVKYLDEISWETEVWVADAPSHMIHFNGVRFLGPYETPKAGG